jgi:hypothetical protein
VNTTSGVILKFEGTKWGRPGITIRKEKGQVQIMTHHSVKVALPKGELFAVKECWHKTSKAKRSCVKFRRSSPSNQAVKEVVSQTGPRCKKRRI